MTTASQHRASLPLFGLVGGLTCLALLVALSAAGCGSGKQTVDLNPDVETSSDEPIPIETILQNLEPDAFGINVPRTLPRGDLDEWADSMLADMIDADVDEDELAEQLAAHVDADQVQRVLRRQFTLQDCTHIRDMLWAREALQAIQVPWNDGGDLDRAVAAFYHVVHTIARTDADETIPLGPFEAMVHGRGSAADRAWTFATLMLQRRIPVVVLSIPGSDTDDSLLVGVIIENQLYLLDAGRGLAVPGPDDAPTDGLIRRPATLAQAIADDGLLRKLDLKDKPYPVTSEQLQQAKLQIVGDTSLWSRRMEGLNNALTGSALVYSPLTGEAGMLQRVTQDLGESVSSDRMAVWDYPDRRRQAREALSESEQTLLDQWDASLQVPYLITVTSKPDELPLTIEAQPNGRQTHRAARVDQILGRAAQAIPRFLKVQGWKLVPPTTRKEMFIGSDPQTVSLVNAALPENVRTQHALAADQARFWRAGCQLQQGNWSTAASDFQSFIGRLSPGQKAEGEYRSQAAYLCGVAYALQKEWGYAAAFMKLVPDDSPHAATARFLAGRWNQADRQ